MIFIRCRCRLKPWREALSDDCEPVQVRIPLNFVFTSSFLLFEQQHFPMTMSHVIEEFFFYLQNFQFFSSSFSFLLLHPLSPGRWDSTASRRLRPCCCCSRPCQSRPNQPGESFRRTVEARVGTFLNLCTL